MIHMQSEYMLLLEGYPQTTNNNYNYYSLTLPMALLLSWPSDWPEDTTYYGTGEQGHKRDLVMVMVVSVSVRPTYIRIQIIKLATFYSILE